MTASVPLIEVRHATKSYARGAALEDISLTVDAAPRA